MTEAVYEYKIPPRQRQRFKAGETAKILDAQLNEIGYVRVIRIYKGYVLTADGRRWTIPGGCWIGENDVAFPFPTIRRFTEIKLKPVDQSTKRLQTKRGFLARLKFDRGQYEDLKMKMLNVIGYCVVLPVVEEDYRKLMDRGEFIVGRNIRMERGEPNGCHRNAAACWEANQDKLDLYTGYYMCQSGIWRQHSWCRFNGDNGQLVETTVKGKMYFGYQMEQHEAEFFVDGNLF